jgi:hypothetical protein
MNIDFQAKLSDFFFIKSKLKLMTWYALMQVETS